MQTWESYKSSGVKTADALVRTGKGFVHAITFSPNDAAPTAGTITLLDGVAAGSGTPLFTWVLPTTVYAPFTVILDVEFTTGLFLDFTTTNDVNVSVSYRDF